MGDRSGAVNRGRSARATARSDRRRGAAAPVEVSASDIERLLRKSWKGAKAHAEHQLESNATATAITEALTRKTYPKAMVGAAMGRRRSLGEQFTDQVKMMPSGLAHLGGQTYRSAEGVFRLRNEGVEALAELFGKGDGADLGPVQDWEDVGRITREYLPVVADQGRSFANTSHRLTNPEEYSRAVQEGRILDAVTEDAANISMVVGGASRVTGAGSRAAAARGAVRTAGALNEASQVLRQMSTLGATAADAPILPLRFAAQTRPVRALLNQAEKLPYLDPELRRQRQFQRDARREVDTEAYHKQQLAEKITKISSDPDLRRASGVVEAQLEREWGRIPDEALDEFAERYNEGKLPEYQVSARAMRFARDYTAGSLDPKLAAKVDQMVELMAGNRADQLNRSLSAGLRPENLLAEPLADVVDAKVEPLRREREKLVERIDTATRIRDRAQNTTAKLGGPDEIRALPPTAAVFAGEALQRATMGNRTVNRLNERLARLDAKIERTVAEASATPEALPARFRTVRNISDASADVLERMADEGGPGFEPLRQLAADMRGKDMNRMVAEGYDPAYLAGGSIRRQPKAPGQNVIPRDRTESFLRRRRSDNIPFDPVDQLRLDIKQATEVGRNNATRRFVTEFAKPARTILGDGIDQMSGEQIAVALREAGFEAYNPKGLWATENPHLLSPDALALPAHIHADLTKSMIADGKIIEVLSAGNRKLKNMLLPLNAKWHTGNTIGGALMAMVGGGVNPIELAQAIGEVRKRGLDDPEFAPLRGMSMASDVQRFVNPGIHNRASLATRAVRKVVGNEDTITPGPVGRTLDRMYRANDFVDSMYRSAVYLAKRRQGLNVEQAVKVAIDAMGDYGKLSPFERRYVKNVLPFYSWTKHITTLAFRLPIEHPMRVVWTLHLAEMFGTEPDPDAPEWEQGGFSIGGRLIGPNVLNPFDGIGDALGPAGVAQSISPVIKIPTAAAFGVDLSTMNRVDRFSGDTSMNLSPGETAAFATNELSLLRSLREILGDEVSYDDLGNVRTVAGEGVYANYQTLDEYGVPTSYRRAVRDAAGEQVKQPDQPIRTAYNDTDVILGIFGFPRRKPPKPTSVPLELPAEVTRGGLVRFAEYGTSDGYLRGADGKLDYVSLARALRAAGIAQQSKPPSRTELERIAEENGVVFGDQASSDADTVNRVAAAARRRSSGRR